MIKRNKLAVLALTSTIMLNSNYAFAGLVDREAMERDVKELINGTIQPTVQPLCNWAKENSWYVDKFKEVAELENPLDVTINAFNDVLNRDGSAKEAVTKMTRGAEEIAEAVADIVKLGSDLSNLLQQDFAPYRDAIASGDNSNSDYMAWLKGAMSKVEHKKLTDQVSGKYSVKSSNIAFGLAKMFDSSNLAGAFYQYAHSDRECPSTTHKNNSHTFGLQGNMYLMDNVYFMGIGTYTDAKTTGDDLGSSGKKMQIYNATGKLGYDFNLGNNMLLTPKLGMGYTNANSSSYTDANNIAHKSFTSSKADFLANVSLQKAMMYDDMEMLGQLFAGVRMTVWDKSDDAKFTLLDIGQDISFPTSVVKTTYTDLGTRFAVSKDNYDISAAYTFSFAKKQSGHVSTLGLKVSF